MNNRGFTLIELLAVVALLAIISGIATISVINAINTSKLKSEKVFIDKLSNLMDDYLDLNKPTTSYGENIVFTKCQNRSCSTSYEASAIQVKKEGSQSIYLKDLVSAGIITETDLVNPKNKQKCLSGNGPEIIVYKDSDYIYYYYVDLTETNTTCDISKENGIINTLPDNLYQELHEKGILS